MPFFDSQAVSVSGDDSFTVLIDKNYRRARPPFSSGRKMQMFNKFHSNTNLPINFKPPVTK